jgi:hypothetical protein
MTMITSDHTEYLSHVSSQILAHHEKLLFWEQLSTYHEELSILADLSLDPVRESLAALYCPTGNGDPKDPCAMLRSWLLMTLCREGSPTVWATRLRREPVLATLAGFAPGDTPGATTHRDFLTRLLDGPYTARSRQDSPLSQQLRGRHRRRLNDTTKARRKEADEHGKTLSEHLSQTLLENSDTPRNPHDLHTRLEQLFCELGLKPTLAANIIPQGDITVAGDGTAEPSAASKDGTRACHCPPGSRCDCPRDYTSNTAQFCYDTQHGWIFGDRSYTISVNVKGRDLPLMTIMGTGNESDFTLSLKALDRLLTLLEDLDLPLTITIFIGDGHHDAIGIYRYLKAKGIVPIIPLDEDSKPQPQHAQPNSTPDNTRTNTMRTPANTDSAGPSPETTAPGRKPNKPRTPRPQIAMYPHITFESDGTPLCPGGKRMRHQDYNARKAAHIFACPATRKNGKQRWVFYSQECPFHEDCTPPEKKMGHTLYIKSDADLRLFPPIPRDANRFKELYALRSGTERQNATADSYNIDRRHRNAAYTLIRLTFVNICKHARIRDAERAGKQSKQERFQVALTRLKRSDRLPK